MGQTRRWLVPVLSALALAAGLAGTPAHAAYQRAPAAASIMAVSRDTIAATANSQVGYAADGNQCQKFASRCDDWCAMFATWVWEQAGVGGVPRGQYVATELGSWGVSHGLFKARPAGQRGSPERGDWAVYGAPGSGGGGHVSVVYSVNPDGTITTIDGNFNNKVAKRTINPVTATAGVRNVGISGYVSPPGVQQPQPTNRAPNVSTVVLGDDYYVFVVAADRSLQFKRWSPTAGWSGWNNLHGAVVGSPKAIVFNNTIHVFVRGTDGALNEAYWDGTWNGWFNLGGPITSNPEVVTTANGYHVFVRGTDGMLNEKVWTGGWSGWNNLGGPFNGNPSAIVANGILHVFVTGTDGAINEKYVDNSGWHGWYRQDGAIVGSPVAITNGSTYHLIGVGTDGTPNAKIWNNGWSNWYNLGGKALGTPAATVQGGIVHVFVTGTDGALNESYWDGQWHGWFNLGGVLMGDPAPMTYKNQRYHVFCTGTDGALNEAYWNNGWFGWFNLSGVLATS